MFFKRGGRTLAQTPAPKKDRVKGSKVNKSGSAKSSASGRTISFGKKTTDSIRDLVKAYNSKNRKKISMATAKAVVRRGMGAYSTSHRPTIRGGKPNSRTAWGLARLKAFMRKKSGSKTANGVVNSATIKKAYTQDNDLMR